MDKKDVLGLECLIELKNKVRIKCFIAAYDESKGMTIKAIDSEECPAWLKRKNDGSVNIFCFDLSQSGHQRMMPLILKHLIRYKTLSRKQNLKLRDVGNFCTNLCQASCVF